MRNAILLIAIMTAGVAAQVPYFQCVQRDGSPVPADTLVYKVRSGNYRFVPLSMPVTGRCHIEVEAYDDRDDITRSVTEAVGIKPAVKDEIEIMILDAPLFDAYVSGTSAADALWTSHRVSAGTFDAKLPAGNYYLVLNNRYSVAAKSVTLMLGRGDPPPVRQPLNPAPVFAPLTVETRQNQPQQDVDDAPPKLQKRRKH